MTGPVVWRALCDTGVDCEICDSVVSRSREKKLLKLMNECRENADKEPFYTGTEAPYDVFVESLRLPLRVAEGGEILLGSERERQDDKWIFLEPLGDTQMGDSIEPGDADLHYQRHGLVIRRDEAFRAIRVDGVDHDAVVLQRPTNLRNWVDGHDEADKHLATRLELGTPASLSAVKVKRRSTSRQEGISTGCFVG